MLVLWKECLQSSDIFFLVLALAPSLAPNFDLEENEYIGLSLGVIDISLTTVFIRQIRIMLQLSFWTMKGVS